MKKMLWPVTIMLVGLLATMVGCTKASQEESAQATSDQAANVPTVSAPAPAPAARETAPPAKTAAQPKDAVDRSAPPAPALMTPPENDERDITLPAGTGLGVRLNSDVSSSTSRAEDPVEATLIRSVKVGEMEVLPVGAVIKGQVVTVAPAGKVKGRAELTLSFTTLTMHGDSYPIVARLSRVAPATKQKDAEKIALPAVGGAVVGAIVGGKKGAAVGAAAGGGAGAAVVMATPGEEVSLPKGSVLALELAEPVKVRVPLKS